MEEITYDFSGWATKANLKCSDNRVILPGAFKHCDGETVPLVWQHMHNAPDNVIGKALLHDTDEGVYAFCSFNNTKQGRTSKALVEHGDVDSLSIHANQLEQQGNNVLHGTIREVSLVLAGANPGAKIENINISHADGSMTELDDDVIIFHHQNIIPKDKEYLLDEEFEDDDDLDDEEFEDDDDLDDEEFEEDNDLDDEEFEEDNDLDHSDVTVGDVIKSMNEVQQAVFHGMLEDALSQGGESMRKNLFEEQGVVEDKKTLTHSDFAEIAANAREMGASSLRKACIQHAEGDYGISDIDKLFPEAKSLTDRPEFIKRKTEWVSLVINGCHHTPFSRIKTVFADITEDEARARGYIKGNQKVDEVFTLLHRVTTPQTIYKKQKLDRDDIVDITDFDVVAWIRLEMRMMLDEEIARAVLIGDGRLSSSPDKIKEDNIRPIYKEDPLYADRVILEPDSETEEVVESVIRALDEYEGTGSPTYFTTAAHATDMLLLKDKMGRRYYRTMSEVADALTVEKVVKVPVMKNMSRTAEGKTYDLLGIAVNLTDYNIGADKGGEINSFEDFDIDFNQYKYLLETRISGALTKPRSAVVVEMERA